MATRHQAPLPPKKEKATRKQQNDDAKNRRALEDIGNNVCTRRVVEGKPQANRRVTRSFRARLIANAEKAAEVDVADKKIEDITQDDSKKPELEVEVVNNEPETKPEAKPKDEHVITIQEDVSIKSEQEPEVINDKPVPELNDESVIVISSESINVSRRKCRKKVYTLSSVLTSRSKVACGIEDKPKESSVYDIDAADKSDEFAVVEYIEDLFKYYKEYEEKYMPIDYIGTQPEINEKMRAILTDWLMEVHHKFELMPETLYLTISIIDRYLSSGPVHRKELQLLGMAAMLIACKYEEIWAPEVGDFICISDKAYTREQILRMEKEILSRLGWNLTVPTLYVFLVRFIKAAMCDKEMENMVFFFAELALMQYNLVFMFRPSIVAASAVLAARCTLKKSPLWTDTLKHYTSFAQCQLMRCTQMLVDSHATAPTGKLQVVYKRYSKSELGAVALKSPATEKLDEL